MTLCGAVAHAKYIIAVALGDISRRGGDRHVIVTIRDKFGKPLAALTGVEGSEPRVILRGRLNLTNRCCHSHSLPNDDQRYDRLASKRFMASACGLIIAHRRAYLSFAFSMSCSARPRPSYNPALDDGPINENGPLPNLPSLLNNFIREFIH